MKHIAKHWKIFLGFEDTKGVKGCREENKDQKSKDRKQPFWYSMEFFNIFNLVIFPSQYTWFCNITWNERHDHHLKW
jgi:hypothetical protein